MAMVTGFAKTLFGHLCIAEMDTGTAPSSDLEASARGM